MIYYDNNKPEHDADLFLYKQKNRQYLAIVDHYVTN